MQTPSLSAAAVPNSFGDQVENNAPALSGKSAQRRSVAIMEKGDGTPDLGSGTRHRRTATTASEIDTTLSHPGSVRINVQGAFIVDQDAGSPGTNGSSSQSVAPAAVVRRGSPDRHETKDIRLPNHTAVVSHIAIDVSCAGLSCLSYASAVLLRPHLSGFND
jgi:hypothetical protein